MQPTRLDSINIYWKRIFHILKKASKPIFKDLGLNKVDANILMTLAYEDEQTKSQLADYLSFKPSALTRSLDRLTELKLVNRVSSEVDKRYIKISLTKKGEKLTNKYIDKIRLFWEAGLKDFSEEERENLDRILQHIFRNLI